MVKAGRAGRAGRCAGANISPGRSWQQLGVSRTAIWKAVAALRSRRHPGAAVTNRGYILSADADVLNAAAVTALLARRPPKPCRSRSSTACPEPTPPCVPVPRMAPRGAGADRPGTIGWARPRRAQLLFAPGRAVSQHSAAAGDRPAPGRAADCHGRRGCLPRRRERFRVRNCASSGSTTFGRTGARYAAS